MDTDKCYVFIVQRSAISLLYKYIDENMRRMEHHTFYFAQLHECWCILEHAMGNIHNHTNIVCFSVKEPYYYRFIDSITTEHKIKSLSEVPYIKHVLKKGLEDNLEIIPIEQLDDGPIFICDEVDLT